MSNINHLVLEATKPPHVYHPGFTGTAAMLAGSLAGSQLMDKINPAADRSTRRIASLVGGVHGLAGHYFYDKHRYNRKK